MHKSLLPCFSSSIPLRHPERSRRIGACPEYSRRAKRFSTIVFERRFLPRPLFYGRGARVAERLGGEGSANSASQRSNLNFLGSPSMSPEYRITLARFFAGEGTASEPGVRVHLHREGGQRVRFLAPASPSYRLFPFPHGKGLGVRLPRAAKNSMVSPDA
jgi:hypothetical protein